MHRPWPFVSVFRLLLLLEGSSCWVCGREGAGTRRSLWGWRGAHSSAGTDRDVRAALRTRGLFPFPTPPYQGSWAQGEGPVSPSALNQIRSCPCCPWLLQASSQPALLEVVLGQ
ncbi:hypothetical protein LUU34_00579400 [Aix galericulata]|nr:hypothetical protein LUU34_00579400 [Aix galericulata]